jgi:tetratricopeptide (TPR) repeat protein
MNKGRGEKGMVFYRHFALMVILLMFLLTATDIRAQSPYDDIMVAQGLRNLQAENYDEALGNFKASWEKGTKTPEKAYYLGIVNYRLTNYPEALRFMEKAIYLDPTFNEARLQLAAIYLALDRPAEALPYLQELEAAGYKPSVTAMYLGQVAAKQDRFAQAEKHFRQAAEEPLLAQEAQIQASLALSKQDKYSDAQ